MGWAGAPARRAPMAAAARALSGREHDILRCLREGKKNAEIGAILGISALTVKNHLQRIYPLLGARNRTEAVARSHALRPAARR
ncbi:helix-turn-helix transcriptional regulator [Massilia sp. H-1]|nr:helix-turn-helix transcriptional regulator [Massilia sp. H-1]